MGLIKSLLAKHILNYSMADFDRDVKVWLGAGQPTHAGVAVTEQTALRHITVYSCVRVRSESFASLPLSVYRKRPNGKGRDEAWAHPLYELIHSVPNPDMTSFTWRETANAHLDLSGNTYSLITTNRRGQVIEIYPLDWRQIWPERNRETNEIEYHLNDRGKIEILPAEKIFHVPGLGYDGIRGYSIIRLAAEAVGTGMALAEFTARFFGQGMNVGGVLETPIAMKEEAVDALRKQFIERGAGLANSWLPIVLHSGLKYSRIPMPLEDAQAIEIMKLNMEQICGLYRVPPHLVANLDRATFCLPADAEIYTAEGPKRILDVRLGEMVWSRQEGGGLVLSPVERVGPSGVDSILRIATTNRAIRLNTKHRVLVRRAKERPLLPGERGGRNQNGRKSRVEWTTEYVPAGELRIGDTIVAFDGTPDSGNWEAPTRTVTIDFMEFCGLYLGDGYMSKGQVTIARSKNATYMDYYREAIRCEFSRYDGGNGRGDKSRVARAPVTLTEAERYTRFASIEAVAELKALGLSGTAHEKRVPGWIFGMADEAKLAFLRGFLDADGSVDKKGRIAYSSCNRELLSGIRHLCMSLGIPVTNITERIGETRLPNGRAITAHQYAFTCSDPGANRLIGSHDKRYVERLEQGQPFGRKGRHYPRYGGRGFLESGAEPSRIVSIHIEPDEPVYDLTVASTHSFVADGVIVHNSNIEHQSISYVVNSMLPLITRFEQTMNWKLFTPAERVQGYYVKFNVDALLRGDAKARAEALAIKRQNGTINANEWRELDDENPIDGPAGDAYLVNGNMISLEAAARQQLKQTREQTQAKYIDRRCLVQSNMSPEEWEEEYEEGNAHWADDLQPSVFAQDFVARLREEDIAGSLLEIGCGNGRDSIFFARAGFNVTAVDVAPSALELAKENAEKAEVEINFVEANAEELPFADGEFNAIFSLSVLHASDLNKSIPETARVLAAGGLFSVYIYGTTENVNGTTETHITVDSFIDLLKGNNYEILDFYSEQEEEFDEAGERHQIIVALCGRLEGE